MLMDIKICNFTIINHLDLAIEKGMTVLTGETGAGKSILVDAILLALGDRADTDLIRQGEDRCEISLYFDISDNQQALAWLSEHELNQGTDCLIRRTLSRDGRSRCYINDQMVSVTRLKELATFLLTIHGQHHNQLLLDKAHQRQQIDSYLRHSELPLAVKQHYHAWQNFLQMEQALQEKLAAAQTRIDFLNYQLMELEGLGLQEGEIEKLESKQKQLARREQVLQEGHAALQKTSVSESEVFKAQGLLKSEAAFSKPLEAVHLLLENAHISLQEANRDLENYLEELSAEPEPLQEIEQRLTDIYTLARKYRVSPEELLALQQKLDQERDELKTIDDQKAQLATNIQSTQAAYQSEALKLSEQRRLIAEKMTERVQAYLPELGMTHATFEIKLTPSAPSAHGLEQVEFWVSTNLGQPLQPLEKVISGGELSRLNLAIQAVFAKEQQMPVLIFDEIDTGMGGAAAEQVGRLMRLLAESTQVVAITHLPQVAVNAHHHYVVKKAAVKGVVSTELHKLSESERTLEVARMLGGLKVTDRALAHARELLDL